MHEIFLDRLHVFLAVDQKPHLGMPNKKKEPLISSPVKTNTLSLSLSLQEEKRNLAFYGDGFFCLWE